MTRPVLLYVDDSFDDRFLFIKAAQRAAAQFHLHTVEHGKQVMRYLTREGPFADPAQFLVPDLLLLDLKMPVMDGFAVLQWTRRQPALARLPVVIFTSSYQHADVQRAYTEGATAFLTKPSLLDDLVEVAKALSHCFTPAGVTPDPLKPLPSSSALKIQSGVPCNRG